MVYVWRDGERFWWDKDTNNFEKVEERVSREMEYGPQEVMQHERSKYKLNGFGEWELRYERRGRGKNQY